MKVYLCTNFNKEKSRAVLTETVERLITLGIVPMLSVSLREEFFFADAEYREEGVLPEDCDLIVTIGGDGTILKWGIKAALAGKPLLGINTGRLGFMTAIEADELDRLSALKNGNYRFSRRMLLDLILSDGRRFSALNDVVLSRRFDKKLPEFRVRINGIDISRLRADGLIFSTPTGSTAYALSAGGPIIEPSVECVEMTLLCAHTLWNRPMIFSANDVITVSFGGTTDEVDVCADGDGGLLLRAGETLTIRRSALSLELVDIENNGFYSAVNDKLIQPFK
ncbi:MAG: NAD(+)/NADH kinase [Bacteroides sp.]|nr:NAD(+)/NADH kinase [Eubacterium sp.]MCM1418942.1 NAD(+)/NADH kinase [Roseburia sp.]MCM1462114.1 NAD(+)/NADH kinase [Bacteroides sp.]